MNKFIYILIFVFAFNFVYSDEQKTENSDVNQNKQKTEEPAPDETDSVLQQPGVDLAALQNYLIYPEKAKKDGIEGRVILRVLVDTDGSVRKALIQHSDSKLLNQAAIDAVKETKFTPALKNGKPIMVWVSIPINFKLKEKEKKK